MQVIFISGDTGCGKSTQVPQYILENDPNAHIIITEVWISIKNSQEELQHYHLLIELVMKEVIKKLKIDERLGESVSYSIKFDSSPPTSIEYMTIGFFLKKVQNCSFKGVTHLIIGKNWIYRDEIHERSFYVDLLLYYSKTLKLNFNFKLILMSASGNVK